MNLLSITKNGIRNKNIRYIVFRYFVYAIQFINTVFIAKGLGPYFMGELGFMMLIVQYLTQINFGIPYSLNVKLATFEGKNNQLQIEYFGNSLIFTFLQSAFMIALAFASTYMNIPIFEKYNFYTYIYLIAFNGILQNFDTLFVNIYRIKNSLKPITLYQTTVPLSNLIACFIWKGKELLYALVLLQVVGYLLSFIVFIYYSPIKLKFRFKFNVQKDLLKSGMALLLFNASFYFILIITRTFVSYFFTIKDLGYFSFALSFAQASFLALNTISFLILPKLINRFKYQEGTELYEKMEYVRSNYNLIAFLLIFFTILIFPLILYFLPAYNNTLKPFTLLSVSLAVLSGSFGISTLFISTGKEFVLSMIALAAFTVNFILVWIISKHSATYYMLCLAPLITYVIYNCLLGYFFNKFYLKKKGIETFFSNFDWKLTMPGLLLVVGTMLDNLPLEVISYLALIALNLKRIKGLIPLIRNLIINPSLFKI
jgi:O-antigen/teichoic acid export membrane protein